MPYLHGLIISLKLSNKGIDYDKHDLAVPFGNF